MSKHYDDEKAERIRKAREHYETRKDRRPKQTMRPTPDAGGFAVYLHTPKDEEK